MMILIRKVTFLAKLLSDNNSHRILASKGDITFSNNVDNLRSINILEQYLGAYADAIYEELAKLFQQQHSILHLCIFAALNLDKGMEYGNTIAQTQMIKQWNMGTQLPKPKDMYLVHPPLEKRATIIVISESSFIDDTVSCHGFDQNTLLFYKMHSSNLLFYCCFCVHSLYWSNNFHVWSFCYRLQGCCGG